MGDTKQGREKQAAEAERRQRERELEEALARGDEPEPAGGGDQLGAFDETLEAHDYPTTTHELIESYGDRELESQDGWTSIADLLASIDDETYDSPESVRRRVRGLLHR